VLSESEVAPVQWEGVEAVAQVVEAAVVTAALIYAAVQLRESVRSRYLSGLRYIMEEFSSPQMRQNRATVLSSRFPEHMDELTEELEGALRETTACLDRIGTLVKYNLNTLGDPLFTVYGDAFLLLWPRISPWLQHQRRTRRGYMVNAEWMVHEARDFWRKRYPDDPLVTATE
jgi:hypothetical protein